MEWVSVKVGLPEEFTQVLLLENSKNYHIGCLYITRNNQYLWEIRDDLFDVKNSEINITHWMTLPEIPE